MPDEPYNLIHERWIPVRDEEGNVWDIAPWEVTKPGGPDDQLPTDLAAPRPDFDGALIQFLIGLVQTAFAPETEREWRLKFKKPPKGDELKKAFERYAHAFNLDGEGPRFMQDYEYAHGRITDGPTKEKISKLLIDAVSNVTRYFNKALSETHLEPSSAAMALFTFQINDPGVGRGHRMTLRKGGPLTTIVRGKTLWQTVWLNVLSRKDFEIRGASQEQTDENDIFPWMAHTRTSEQKQLTTSDDVHPLQMYWPMPSRILLHLTEATSDREFSLGGTQSDVAFHHFEKKNEGVKYSGPWNHPLTPYAFSADGTSTWAIAGETEVLSYRDWLGTTVVENQRRVRPAKVVRMSYRRASYSIFEKVLGSRPRIWAFGYGMDSAKARTWQDSTMPLFLVEPEVRIDFENFAARLVNTADYLINKLAGRKKLKSGEKKRPISVLEKALYCTFNGSWSLAPHVRAKRDKLARDGSDLSDISVFTNAKSRFWRDTEPIFFDYLAEAQKVLEDSGASDLEEDLTLDLRKKWLKKLRKHLRRLYDGVTNSSTFHGADPKSVALARRDLRRAASAGNEDIRKRLNLPKEETS